MGEMATGSQPKRLDRLELEFFHEQTALLLNAGLPLPQGIRRFSRDIRNPRFRQSLNRLAQGLEQGESLAQAMEQEERFFPPAYVALIRVGEQGGDLVRSLDLAMEQERFQADFRSRLKNSLFYPLLVLVLVCATYSIAIWKSYPVFLELYERVGAQVPLMSRWAYGLFTWTGRHGAVAAGLFLAIILILRWRPVRLYIHGLWLKVPLLGRVLKERFITCFSAGLAVLLEAGIPIGDSLGLLAGVSGNRRLSSDLERAAASAREGASLETTLSSVGVFPDLYKAAALTGEKSGMLPNTLSGLARMYRSETEYHTRLFLQVLDVGVILLVGIWSAALLIAMYRMYWHLTSCFDSVRIW
jgi:type II secretory pathway component PulF